MSDLPESELTKTCSHGKTPKPSESKNRVIWACLPTTVFIVLKTFNFEVSIAVESFDKGAIVNCHVLKTSRLEIDKHCVKSMKAFEQIKECMNS